MARDVVVPGIGTTASKVASAPGAGTRSSQEPAGASARREWVPAGPAVTASDGPGLLSNCVPIATYPGGTVL